MPRISPDALASDSAPIAIDETFEQRNSAIIARIRLRPQRRQCARTAVLLPAVIIVGGSRRDGLVTDLGIGGLFVQADFVPSCGVRVAIEITHTCGSVKLPVVVRWIDDRGFGAQFELLAPTEAQMVMTLISDARHLDQ